MHCNDPYKPSSECCCWQMVREVTDCVISYQTQSCRHAVGSGERNSTASICKLRTVYWNEEEQYFLNFDAVFYE